MEEVLELQGDGEASPWSWASPGWVSFQVPLAALTLCVHVLVSSLRPSSTLFSLATNATDNFLTIDFKKRGMTFSVGGVWNSSTTVIHPGLWTSLCMAYHPARGWTKYIDGNDDNSGFLHGPDGRAPPQTPARAGWVVIGQDQDKIGGGYQADQSFSGSVARLRVWSRRLRPEDIVAVAQCDSSQDYDAVLVWPSSRVWTLNHTAQLLQVPRLDICRPKGPFLMLLSAKMALGMAQRLCTAAASRVVIPASQGETEIILSLALEAGSSCSGRSNEPLLWLGLSDEDTEGRWVDEEGRLLSYENWMEGQPNGMRLENRAVMTNAGTWMDLHTRNYQYCAVCSTKSGRPLLLRMRGLCSSLQHDTRYIQEGHVLAKPFFRGFTVSSISWNGTEWLAQHKASPEVVLSFMPEDHRELPLGRKTWVVAGRSDCGDESGRLVLTLTACEPGHFTCDDGACIPADMRCDFQPDCKDESDETECEIATLPPAYKSNIPPRSASPQPDSPAHPVYLHINVLSLEIVTEKMEIVMDFSAALRWTDPRLVFRDLKHDQATNALQLPALRSLWVPQVSFSNAKGNAHTLLDEETKGLVLRYGDARLGDYTHAREVNFFSGEENPVVASRKYSATYRCSLDLTLYPFDTQECNFEFLLTSALKERLQMVQDGEGVTYSGSRQLLEYSIVSIVARPANHTRFSALQAVVRFRRRYGFAILTVYTPSCFFVIIAYLTTFYPLTNLQVRVVIALTAMLVLTTLLSQVSSNLPRNSYFKALDVWMFGAIGLIFSILILQTVVDVLARGEEASKVSPKQSKGLVQVESSLMDHRKTPGLLFPRTPVAPRMMRAMQVGYPAVTLGLVVAYIAYLFTALN